jgi:hypothetical protein
MSTTTGTPAARAAAAAAAVAVRDGSWLRPGAGQEDDAAFGDRCARHVVDGEKAVRAVVAIERQRKLVWRLDRQNHRARPAALACTE